MLGVTVRGTVIGIPPHDSWFAFIAAADEGDDWTHPEVWRKAHPKFGVSVEHDDLAPEKAIALPGAQQKH
jgi:phage terminase large subunit-like protein